MSQSTPFRRSILFVLTVSFATAIAAAQYAVRAETLYTMTSAEPLRDATVVIVDGKIAAVGPTSTTVVPPDATIVSAKVVMPGLIDVHTCAGLTGYLNQPHDQDQVDRTSPIQPELRAIDAFNSDDRLIEWIRGLGVTTIHTGHGPLAVVSGQTMIVKTSGKSLDRTCLSPAAMMAATLSEAARAGEGDKKSGAPGTRARAVFLLRDELQKAREYKRKLENPDPAKRPDRNLRLEALTFVLDKKMRLLCTVHRRPDIVAAIRLAKEFDLSLVIDGASDAPLLLDEIRDSGFPVVCHPTMQRAGGDTENSSMTTPARLVDARIKTQFQTGFEAYVPKTRVVLFEAAAAVAYGLSRDVALRMLTIEAAEFLGIAEKVGSIAVGKDADLALYDGDPFEWTTHCVGVFIDGERMSRAPR